MRSYFATAPGGLRALSDKVITPLAGGLTKSLIEAVYDVDVEMTTWLRRTALARSSPVRRRWCVRALLRRFRWRVVAPGSRVGLLAAFTVGERSTQNAMKAFQGGTLWLSVGSPTAAGVGQRAHGYRRLARQPGPVPAGARPSLPRGPHCRLRAPSGRGRCLSGRIRAAYHLEVLWRRLRSVQLSHPDQIRLLSAAQWPGSAFVHATARGDLSSLVESLRRQSANESDESSLRVAVIQERG